MKVNMYVGAKDDLGHPMPGTEIFVFRISQMAFPEFAIEPFVSDQSLQLKIEVNEKMGIVAFEIDDFRDGFGTGV